MPNIDNSKMLFIVNPIAGRTHGSKNNLQRVMQMFKDYGYHVTMKKTASKGHATELVHMEQLRYNCL